MDTPGETEMACVAHVLWAEACLLAVAGFGVVMAWKTLQFVAQPLAVVIINEIYPGAIRGDKR